MGDVQSTSFDRYDDGDGLPVFVVESETLTVRSKEHTAVIGGIIMKVESIGRYLRQISIGCDFLHLLID